MFNFDNSSKGLRVAAAVAATLWVGSAFAQSESEGFSATVDIGMFHDDNLTLASTTGETIVDDFAFHLKPDVAWSHKENDNLFSLSADADWRKGVDSDLNETNVQAGGSADLHHPSGWRLELSDTFSRRTFDQALTFAGSNLAVAEPGVSKQVGNKTGVHAEYKPGETFSLGAGYDFSIDDFKFGNVGGADRRQLHHGDGAIEVPIAAEWSAYGNFDYITQLSRERATFEFDDQRYVGGLRWRSPSDLEVYGEAGWQGIGYGDVSDRVFDEVVARVGFNAPLTEQSSLFGSIGRNGYDEVTFTAGFKHDLEDQSVSFNARRSTENSFSNSTLGRIFLATVVSGAYRKDLQESWHLFADASVFQQEASGFGTLDNKTYQGSLKLIYDFRPQVSVGAMYRYSRRDSNIGDQEFEDNRVTLFIRLSHKPS